MVRALIGNRTGDCVDAGVWDELRRWRLDGFRRCSSLSIAFKLGGVLRFMEMRVQAGRNALVGGLF